MSADPLRTAKAHVLRALKCLRGHRGEHPSFEGAAVRGLVEALTALDLAIAEEER